MAILNIKRLATLPTPLEVSTMYITKNASNAALVDLTFVGNTLSDVRSTLGQADVQSAIDVAIANLTAAQIPDLPGSKIISDITVNTSGNAATATLAATASKLAPGATINGVNFTGEAPITISAVDTVTPRVPQSAVGVSVAPLVDGKVPEEYLPLSLDNIDSFPTLADFPATGREDVIYVAKDTNFTYRWDGTGYVQLGAPGGTATEANRLTQARQIALTGDATGSTMFDGSQNVSIAVTLESVGTAGEQGGVVTTDAQGRVVSSRALLAADIPALPGSKINSVLSVDTTGNAATATALKNPVTINLTGDVTGSAVLTGSDATLNLVTTVVNGGAVVEGYTGTATKVVVENGLVKSASPLVAADIPNLPGTKITSDITVNTSGNAATATLATNATNAVNAATAQVALALQITAEW